MLRSIGTQSRESVESVLTHTHGRGQKSVQKVRVETDRWTHMTDHIMFPADAVSSWEFAE